MTQVGFFKFKIKLITRYHIRREMTNELHKLICIFV
jgi:hypothetical protein